MPLTAADTALVLGDRERVIAALNSCEPLARSTVDPELLALCEARVAELLGDTAKTRLDPIGPADSQAVPKALKVACLAFTEQWVIDVASMTDELVSNVADHLGDDGLMDFVHALLVVEQRIRLSLAWKQLGLLEGSQPA